MIPAVRRAVTGERPGGDAGGVPALGGQTGRPAVKRDRGLVGHAGKVWRCQGGDGLLNNVNELKVR